MLKEASKRCPEDVLSFVLQHRNRMPRMTLRVAMLKLPAEQRHQALENDSR